MRIIYGRDYYDSGLAYGRDDDIVYVRHRDKCWTNDEARSNGFAIIRLPILFDRVIWRSDGIVKSENDVEYGVSPIVVWACNKMYRGIKILHEKDVWCFWNYNDAKKFLDEKRIRYSEAIKLRWSDVRETFEDYFKTINIDDHLQTRMIESRISIVTYSPDVYSKNMLSWRVDGDNLKDLQFYRAVDPTTMFQEISMWIGNLGQPGREMIEVSNDIKIAKAGFDKMSFRKGKSS